jgi:hypothetical protein
VPVSPLDASSSCSLYTQQQLKIFVQQPTHPQLEVSIYRILSDHLGIHYRLLLIPKYPLQRACIWIVTSSWGPPANTFLSFGSPTYHNIFSTSIYTYPSPARKHITTLLSQLLPTSQDFLSHKYAMDRSIEIVWRCIDIIPQNRVISSRFKYLHKCDCTCTCCPTLNE